MSSVTDGDTIRVTINGKSTPVRLIGIGTPEVTDPRRPAQRFGREASRQAHELMDDTPVWFEYGRPASRRRPLCLLPGQSRWMCIPRAEGRRRRLQARRARRPSAS
ncbi:thermonuclease family protein [Arthrobacter sp. NPDC058097]|uniref:thermonuclease family protein n=1 Tax=Arthrobacter sp. NPDC058097 TaxID=3346340 RepID=UPI0036DCB51E